MQQDAENREMFFSHKTYYRVFNHVKTKYRHSFATIGANNPRQLMEKEDKYNITHSVEYDSQNNGQVAINLLSQLRFPLQALASYLKNAK